MRELWASRPYRILFLAGFLSELGTFISEVAILMRIFELVGHQKQYLGITQGIFLIFMILGTLLGGVFGEGRAKTKILLGCEIARVPVLVTMLACTDEPWVLIAGNGLVAFFSGAFNPTRQALMNELLPGELLPKANSVFAVSFAFLHALGPVVGALFYAGVQKLGPVLMLDLGTYFLGIVLLLSISPRAPNAGAADKSDSGFWEELRSGFLLLRERLDFFWIVVRCVLASTALGIVIPMLLPVATEVLGLPDSAYGYLLGVFGLGGAFGSLLLPKLLSAFSVQNTLRFLVVGEGGCLFLWAFTGKPTLSFILAFLYGALLFARITSQLNFVSLELPAGFNARANALIDLAMVVPNVAGAGIVGVFGATLDTSRFLLMTALLLCAGVLGACVLEWRQSRGGASSSSA
jgi:MFS family permease